MEALVAMIVAAILIAGVGGHGKAVERDYSIERGYSATQKEDGKW